MAVESVSQEIEAGPRSPVGDPGRTVGLEVVAVTMCEHCKRLWLPHRGEGQELLLVELEDQWGRWTEWLCWDCADLAVAQVLDDDATLQRVAIYGFDLPRVG